MSRSGGGGGLSGEASTRNYGSTSTSPEPDLEVGFSGGGGGGGGAGSGGGSSQFDSTLYRRLCDEITSNIFAIAKHGSTLEKTLRTIGSLNDSSTVRESIHVLQVTANRTISETAISLKRLKAIVKKFPPGSGKEEQMRLTRLTSDFQTALQQYTDLQKQIVTKMKTTFLPPSVSRTTSFAETDDQSQSLVADEAQRAAQLQITQALEFEQGLMIEREQKIRQIESDILDVNDIMRDLGTMVHEQGDVIDTIEGHIEVAHSQVDSGVEQLQKASTYQTRYRKRLFCLLGTGFIVLLIVVIILISELKS